MDYKLQTLKGAGYSIHFWYVAWRVVFFFCMRDLWSYGLVFEEGIRKATMKECFVCQSVCVCVWYNVLFESVIFSAMT